MTAETTTACPGMNDNLDHPDVAEEQDVDMAADGSRAAVIRWIVLGYPGQSAFTGHHFGEIFPKRLTLPLRIFR